MIYISDRGDFKMIKEMVRDELRRGQLNRIEGKLDKIFESLKEREKPKNDTREKMEALMDS